MEMDYLLQRGGNTDQEILRTAERAGISLDSDQLRIYQEKWARAMKRKIERFVIDEFVDANPEFAAKRKSLQCINRYTLEWGRSLTPLIDLTPYLKKGSMDEFEELAQLEPASFREAFFERINPEKITRVGQTSKPVPTDIYLAK
jgi:hypothetical protein